MKRPDFKLTPLALALSNAGLLMFATALMPGVVMAQVPTGGVVTQGNATITNVSPTQQRITQTSDKAVINWQSFSIGAPNSVVFAQPGAGSVVLNRVVGGNESVILGRMSANGQVFLVNPNGVYFGPNAVVDVTGIVATTHNIQDGDFMAGRFNFSRDPSSPAGANIINDGLIRAKTGGYVVLAGDYAANNGIIEARLGTAILAAAGKFTLDITGDNLINFAISEQTLSKLAGVSNSGQILADGGRVVMTASVARDLSATVVNNSGVVQARGTTERDGAIYLTADGGDVTSSGRLDVSGARGGQITAQAEHGTTLVSGTVDASGSTGAGGQVRLLGERVGLMDAASVDVSGLTGGGTALIGGDFQGGNASIQNAQRTYVASNASINADALSSGNGGKVIVWSDDITRYYGNISARGGAQSGNGGFAEVSGHRLLDFHGGADLSSTRGTAGSLLLDPLNITITNTAAANTTGFVPPGDQTEAFADDGATTSNFNVTAGTGSFANVASGTTITLQANNNVTVSNAFDLATATGKANVSLNLQAKNDITLNAGITASGTGTLSLAADTDATGGGAISGAGVLTQANGTLALSAGSGINVTTVAPTVTFANTSGAVAISNTAAGGLTVSGTNAGGNVALTNAAGTLTLAGINETGGGSVTAANTGAINTTGAISTAANGDISLTATGGTLTVGNTVAAGGSGNVTLATTGNNNIAINNSVGGAANNVFLNSGGAITGSGTVTADGLALKTGTGGIGSSGTPLAIAANKLAAQAPAGIFVAKSAGALAIGGVGIVGSPTGVSTTAANGDISISAPTLTVNEAIVPNGTGTTTLSADAFALNAAISGSTVTLQPKTAGTAFTLGLGASGAGLSQAELLNVTTNTLRIGSATSQAGAVTFDGDLALTNAQGALSINSTGAITQAANTKVVTPGGFAAQTGSGSITLAEVNNDLHTVALNTTGDVTLRNLNPFVIATIDGIKGIHAANLSLTTGLATTGDVASIATFSSSSTLTVASANGLAVGDRILIAGAGAGGSDLVTTITAIAGNTITFASRTTGNINTATDPKSLTVASAAGLNVNDQISIAGAGDLGATLTTTITAIAGTTLTLANGATTTVAAVNVTKGRAASSTVTNATVTRLATTGTVAQGSTSLTVASTSGLAIGDRIVVPGAGTGSNNLATTITGISGNVITLGTAAATGVINAFVAKPTFIGGAPTTGTASASSTTLTVASASGYAIGDAILVAGAGASGANLATTIAGVAGNTITLAAAAQTAVTNANVYHTDQSIVATGTVTLNSILPSGFTETGGSLSASQLALKGYGPYNLNGTGSANHVGTLAGDVTGGVSYVDTGAIIVGSVGGVTGLTTRSMLITPASSGTKANYSDANISLSTNATSSLAAGTTAISITQPIKAGVKNTPDPADDASPVTDRTGQLLLFLVDDTKAVTSGAGSLEASLLNLSAELGKGTFDLTTNVGSLLLNGSKDATIDNHLHTGLLTAFTLGVQDIATTGTASSSATVPASSLTDNNQTFFPNQHAGRKIEITGGTGVGQIATITSNDAHTLVIASAWTTAPDSTSTYRIGENKDLRAGNVTLRTGGDLNAAAINVTGNLALSSEGAGAKQTITLLSSSGQNILLRADGLTLTTALTTPGVNVVLQPFTTSNTIGIHNATGTDLPHQATTGGIDIGVDPKVLTVASGSGFAVGDTIVIAGAGPGGAALTTSITAIAGTTVSINDAATATVAAAAVTNTAVGAGATNYSSALLNQFHPQANITIGGDTDAGFPLTFPLGGITGTPRQTGNVFIGADGAPNLGTRNLNVSTTGNIVAHNLGTVNNVALVAGGAGGITLEALNSAGTNLLFKANSLSMPSAAANYTTAAAVKVSLQPFTLSNTVGVHNAIDYHTNAVGNSTAGSDLLTVNTTSGFAAGNTIDVLGAGAGGATLTTTISALGPIVSLGTTASTAVNNVTVTITPTLGGPFTTTGTIRAGSGSLIVASNININPGDTIKITGAGAAGVDLTTTVSALPTSPGILLGATTTTAATNTLIGLQSTKQTINTNYALDLINKFNATAAITVSGTSVSAGPSNTLTGNIHTGSDSVTGVTPFNIGTRTLTVSTTGSIFTHTAAAITTGSSGTNGTIPTGTATWTPGSTPTPGNGVVPGGGGPGGGGGGPGGPGPGSGPGGPPGTAGPSPDPGAGPIGAATPPTPSTPTPTPPGTGTPGGPTPPDPGGGPNPLPTPGTDPGGPGVIVIGYTPDPDPTPDPTGPIVVVDPGTPDPGTPDPGTPDPGTPIGPVVVVDPGTPDPGTTPGTPDPGTPIGPVVVVDPGTPDPGTPGTPDPVGPIAGGPGTPDPGTPDPGTPDPGTPIGPIAVDPGTPDPGTPVGPIAGDPGTPDPGTPDPGTPGGPIAGGPGTPGPGTPDPGTPIGPIAVDPGSPDPGTPGGPIAGGPGTPDPGSPGGPIAGGPGTPGPGTPDPGAPIGPIAVDPGSPDPGTPGGPIAGGPGAPDPGTPGGPIAGGPGTPDPGTPGGPIAGGPGTPSPGTPDPGTPIGPIAIDPGSPDPGIPGGPIAGGPGTPDPGTPGGPIAGGPGTPSPGTPDPGTPIGPIAIDPGSPDPGIPGGPIAGGPGTPGGPIAGGPGTPDPGTPGGPIAGGPAAPGSSGPGGPVAGGPGSTDPGNPDGPVAGGPGTPSGGTPSGTTPGSGTTTASTGSTTGTTSGSTDPGNPTSTTSSGSTSGGTTTAAAGGTPGAIDGNTTESSNDQATVNCPPGTSAATSKGGAAGPCVAIGGVASNGKAPAGKPALAAVTPPVAKPIVIAPAVSVASQQGAQGTPGAPPNTSAAPAPVVAVQGDGVNLYREGRGNGPGTPRR